MSTIKTHENLHKNVNENLFSFTFLCKFSCLCNFAIFVQIFKQISPKCRTKKLGMIYTILGSFCLFLNWEGAYIRPQIRLRKIPEREHWDSFCYSVRNDSFTFMSLIYFAVTMTSFFLIGDKKRRDTVQCIRYVPSLDYYISCSQKGTVALWTSKVCYALFILMLRAVGLENSTRPLVFTSASGCRASKNFTMSSEN